MRVMYLTTEDFEDLNRSINPDSISKRFKVSGNNNNASILHLKNIVAQQNIVIKSLNERCELLECRNEEYEIMVKSVRDTKNPNIFKQIEWWGEVLI